MMEPVPLPREALVVKYLAFIYFGIAAAIAGVPIFDLVQPAGYALPWGILMALAGFAGVVGVCNARLEHVEMWSVLVLWSLSLAYVIPLTVVAYSDGGDAGRQAISAGMTVILVIPLARFLWLAFQWGKTK